MNTWSRHSVLTDLTQRSAMALARGDLNGVRSWAIPILRARRSKGVIEVLKLERSSRYLCSAAFITFISKPHDDVPDLILAPYNQFSAHTASVCCIAMRSHGRRQLRITVLSSRSPKERAPRV